MWLPPIFAKLVARRSEQEEALRFGGASMVGPPIRVGTFLPDAQDAVASQPALPGMFVRLTDPIEPWGLVGEPLTAHGGQLHDQNGKVIV
jgi:hypothetical protein